MSSKKTFLILLIVVIVLAALCAMLLVRVGGNRGGTYSVSDPNLSDYSAVYMTTGDIYYGKLSWSPSPKLTDVWVLQRPAVSGGQYAIVPLKTAFWGPSDEVDLNASQIIFTTRIRNDSQIIPYFTDPSLLNGQQIPPQPTPFQSVPQNK